MPSQKGLIKNAKSRYSQQVLSGFERPIQHGNENGNSKTDRNGNESKATLRKTGMYKISIPVIIEQVSFDGYQYDIKVCINDDADISISAISRGSKKPLGKAVTVAQETHGKTLKIPMVYGVHPSGEYTLSYSDKRQVPQGITQLYSFLLVQIDRALQCALLDLGQQENTKNARKRNEGTYAPKDVGTNKKRGRGEKVLPEVLPETASKETAKLDEADREILGGG